jgi:hypothetical protein
MRQFDLAYMRQLLGPEATEQQAIAMLERLDLHNLALHDLDKIADSLWADWLDQTASDND